MFNKLILLLVLLIPSLCFSRSLSITALKYKNDKIWEIRINDSKIGLEFIKFKMHSDNTIFIEDNEKSFERFWVINKTLFPKLFKMLLIDPNNKILDQGKYLANVQLVSVQNGFALKNKEFVSTGDGTDIQIFHFLSSEN